MGNNETFHNITKTNSKLLTDSLVDLSLDDNKGTPQHKTALLHSMTSHKFPAKAFLEPFVTHYRVGNFTWPSSVMTDVRITKELPVYYALHQRFGSTIDSMQGNFPYQSQTNQDFWLKVKSGVTLENVTFRHTYHDEKSGMDMFRHSTRGSIGLLTYDAKGNNVQVTSKPIIPQDFIKYNKDRYNNIEQALKLDGLADTFKDQIKQYLILKNLIENIKQDEHQNIFDAHNEIQEYLWNSFQRHPEYNRSTSFIFTSTVDYSAATGKQQAFEVRFASSLNDKIYDLTNKGDRTIIFNAALNAYRMEVDSKILDKLYYYHNDVGIILNPHFLQTITNLINHGL